jgi:hypothetical protein
MRYETEKEGRGPHESEDGAWNSRKAIGNTEAVGNPDLAAETETRLNALPSRCTWRLVLIERVKQSAPSPESDARFECVMQVSEQLPVNKEADTARARDRNAGCAFECTSDRYSCRGGSTGD